MSKIEELKKKQRELEEKGIFKECEVKKTELKRTKKTRLMEFEDITIKKEKDANTMYGVKKTDKALSLSEAEDLAKFFTRKDLYMLFGNQGNKSRAEIIMEMSAKGVLPKPPIRKYACKNCDSEVVINEYCLQHNSPWGLKLCKKCYDTSCQTL